MKILYSGNLARSEGGPAQSMYWNAKGLMAAGVDCRIVSLPLTGNNTLFGSDVPVAFFPRVFGKLCYCPSAGKFLRSLELPDVAHIQGLWRHTDHAVASFCRSRKIPYVVSLRGMLYPQAYRNGAYCVKKLVMTLWQRADLDGAACIHATCREEAEYFRALGFAPPVAVIPNAVALPEILPAPTPGDGIFRVGYLGRLHPYKRLERLISAFAAADIPGAELVLAGNGAPDYEKKLRAFAAATGKNIRFAGFVAGEKKVAVLRSFSVLALLSDSENFGNSVTDALMQGVPVLASRGTPWKELEEKCCGVWIGNDVETVARYLRELAQIPLEERLEMGKRGQNLLRERYSLDVVTRQWLEIYRQIAQSEEKPVKVFT